MRKRKPGALHKGWKGAAVKAKAPPAAKKDGDSAYWAEVVEAMATKKTPPRRPRG